MILMASKHERQHRLRNEDKAIKGKKSNSDKALIISIPSPATSRTIGRAATPVTTYSAPKRHSASDTAPSSRNSTPSRTPTRTPSRTPTKTRGFREQGMVVAPGLEPPIETSLESPLEVHIYRALDLDPGA